MNDEIMKLKPAKRRILRAMISSFIGTITSLILMGQNFGFTFLLGGLERIFNFILAVIFLYMLIGFAIALITLIYSLFLWRGQFIYIEDKKITYESTFIFKRKTSVPIDKINVINVRRTFWDLILRTSTINIDSGSKTTNLQSELALCFDKNFANKYADFLRAYKKALEEKEEFNEEENFVKYTNQEIRDLKEEDKLILKMRMSDKIRYAFTNDYVVYLLWTLIRGIFVGLLAFIWFHQINDFFAGGTVLTIWLVILGIFITTIATSIIAFLNVFFRYYKFTITKHDDGISIEKGLFDRKNIFVPYDKIHGYSVNNNLLQQIFKMGSIRLSVVGIDSVDLSATNLFIAANKRKLDKIIDEFLPQFKTKVILKRPRKRSLIHTLVIPNMVGTIFFIPVFVILFYFFMPIIIILIWVALFLLEFIEALLVYKNAALDVKDDFVISSCGGFYKRYTVTKTSSVQCITNWAGCIRRKQKIATYHVFYRGSSVIMGGNTIKNIDVVNIDKLK